MGKRKPYRISHVNTFRWQDVVDDVEDQIVTIGIDVAKEKMVAAVVDGGEAVLKTVGWSHPVETERFVEFLQALERSASSIDVVMEPSGVYGDALRWQLWVAGFRVHRVSPKKSNDADEIYDGVPSSHDAKCAGIVAWLHLRGKSDEWPVASEEGRRLKAALWVLEVHAKQFRQNRNRLEAITARHWPELSLILDLDSATLLELLSAFGGPQQVAAEPQGARALMRKVGGSALEQSKIEAVIESAAATVGLPPIDEETELAKAIAQEARRNQKAARAARKRVETLAQAGPSTQRMQAVIGKTTAAVVFAAAGDPALYESPQALVKSLGLNLKERSSGKKQNRALHITKRGSGTARMFLYMAALRLIKNDRVVRAWYARKVARDGGRAKIKAVVAVVRKLTLALWHVARGATFDARLLFDVRRLDLGAT